MHLFLGVGEHAGLEPDLAVLAEADEVAEDVGDDGGGKVGLCVLAHLAVLDDGVALVDSVLCVEAEALDELGPAALPQLALLCLALLHDKPDVPAVDVGVEVGDDLDCVVEDEYALLVCLAGRALAHRTQRLVDEHLDPDLFRL